MYGRGATDDKGFIIALISALEALMEIDGTLPVNVMFLLDGAEEFGSQSMPKWLGREQRLDIQSRLRFQRRCHDVQRRSGTNVERPQRRQLMLR